MIPTLFKTKLCLLGTFCLFSVLLLDAQIWRDLDKEFSSDGCVLRGGDGRGLICLPPARIRWGERPSRQAGRDELMEDERREQLCAHVRLVS